MIQRHRGLVASALVALTVCLAFGAAAQKWCLRPSGAGIQAALYADTQKILPLLEKMAGKRSFVVLRQPSAANLGDSAAFAQGYASAIPGTAREQGFSDAEIAALMAKASEKADENHQELAAAGEMTDSDGSTTKTAYVYSNAPAFISDRGEQGATIEGSPDEFEKLLWADKDNSPPLIYSLFKKWGAKVIFVSGFDLSRTFIDSLPPEVTVMRLMEPPADTAWDFAAVATNSDPSNTVVMFAMPTTDADAAAWGFEPQKASDYASAGAAALKKLELAGVKVTKVKDMSPAEIALKAQALRAVGRRVVLLGEGTPAGDGLRLPGSDVPLNLADHAAAMNGAMLMFCNSAVTHLSSSLSVIGRIYINEATRMIIAVAGEKATGLGSQDEPVNDLVAAEHSLSNWLYDVVRPGAADGLTLYRISAAAPCVPPDPKCPGPDQDRAGGPPQTDPQEFPRPVALFAVGALGGALKEFMRWRALAMRGGNARYLKLPFLLLTGVFVLFAGAVGLIFGRVVPSEGWSWIVALTAGLGLEEIVRLGSRLKIWRFNVPLGDGKTSVSRPTLAEFLRR